MPDHHAHFGYEEVTCREFVGLVTDYWEGALADHRHDLVEEHLVMCDWCKTYLEQLRATVEALPRVPEPEPVPADAEARLLAAFRARRNRG
jgi:predicted anti-sigma-YlaC factor YlaD